MIWSVEHKSWLHSVRWSLGWSYDLLSKLENVEEWKGANQIEYQGNTYKLGLWAANQG